MVQRKCKEAKDLMDQVKPSIKEIYSEIMYHYHYNMGLLHFFHKDHVKAVESYTAAYDAGFDDYPLYKFSLYFNLGLCYSHLGMYLRAIDCYLKADHLFRCERGEFLRMHLDNNLALDYIKIGETELAKRRLKEVIHYAEVFKNNVISGRAMTNLGRACIKEKEYNRALDYFEVAKVFVNEGEEGHFGILYYKILCLIMMNNSQAESELAYARSVLQGNDRHMMHFNSLSHLLTLDDNSSVDYIKNTSTPFLMENFAYHRIVDIYEIMENHFMVKGDRLKALEIKSLSSDLYKIMMQGNKIVEKRALGLLLAIIMVASTSVTAFADPGDDDGF